MKKKILLILLVLSMTMTLLPVPSFAEGDSGLEQAIKTAKTIFEIPDSYNKFDYNVNTIGDRKIWYLHWSKKDEQEYNISVSVDDQGSIRNYSNYIPYQYEQRRLPKVGRQEALELAKTFIDHVNPGLLPRLKLVEENWRNAGSPYFSFEFTRLESGIPYPANQIRITVNNETGRIENYNYNWSDKGVFPAADKKITLDAAKTAFREKLGIRLTYQSTYEDEKIKVFPVFAPVYDQMYVLDAITGEKVNLGSYYRTYSVGAYDMKNEKAMLSSKGKGTGPELTEEELKAIEKVSKLLTREEADSLIRKTDIMGLNSEFILERSNLSKDWQSREDFVWDLSYLKGSRSDSSSFESVYVRLDAKTGSIKSFYIYHPDQNTGKAKLDEKSSRAAVEKFLKEFKPDLFNQVVYEGNGMENIIYPAEKMPQSYNFRYIRMVNGVPFPGNSITVGINTVTGKISEFNSIWYNMEFPSIDKVMSIDKAYNILFEKIGLELEYRPDYTKAESAKILPQEQDNPPAIRLVYALNQSKSLWIDPFTGVLLNYQGEPYKEVKTVEYSDIQGHYAQKQIQALAEYGIALQGTEFKPDEHIIQADFFRLLLKSLNNYYLEEGSEDKEIDVMYKVLIREGIVKDSEKSPKSSLSREDAVKFIIRALKYGKVAEIKGIYQYPFKDMEQANAELLGHITLAKGLGLVEGTDGYFQPKNNVTRAQAVIMLYNYLQR